MLLEFSGLFVFLLFSWFLSSLIVFGSIFLVRRSTDIEKVSAYECGFHPFSDTRGKFEVRFYLVAILFIIFDLEIIFLFPWCVQVVFLNLCGYWSIFIFLMVLLLGFLYEWEKGALDWE